MRATRKRFSRDDWGRVSFEELTRRLRNMPGFYKNSVDFRKASALNLRIFEGTPLEINIDG